MRVTFNGRDLTKLHTRLELLSDESKAKIRQHMQDTAVKLYGQRSETMETYSLPEALEKAKAGATMTMGNLVIKYDGGRWKMYEERPLTGVDFNTVTEFVDVDEWQEEQPEIQPGDWIRFSKEHTRLDGCYALVTLGDEKNGIIANHLNSSQAFLGNCGTFFKKDVEKVTDERALMFLNAGRKPEEFKEGDLIWLDSNPYELYGGQDALVAEEDKLEIICFVEDRKDRGDTP